MESNTALYDAIASGYNTTRQADPYITGKLFQFLSPKSNGIYLDIGCGTGNYTIALANKELGFTGVEPSAKMLDIAKPRNNVINWLLGNAEQLPAEAANFDGAIATLTVHHWLDMDKAMKEIYRALKPGGRLVLFTATPKQMKGYWLNHYFPKMMDSSILQMPSFEAIAGTLEYTGFKVAQTEKYFIHDDLKDLFLYAGKNRPGLYFDQETRKGISSFAALANAAEVGRGLLKLREDMKQGRFETIKADFKNDLGDYLFVVAEKPGAGGC